MFTEKSNKDTTKILLANKKLFITNVSGKIKVFIYALSGELIFMKIFKNTKDELEINLDKEVGLKQGSYTVIAISDDGERSFKKFIYKK